jgi:hypothetical protein
MDEAACPEAHIVTQTAFNFDALLLGNAGRDKGIKLAVDKADREIDDWSERAYQFILKVAASGEQFTCPGVRAVAEAEGFPLPPTKFAWGGPMQRAARNKKIKRVGYLQHGDATMHTQPVSVWVQA